MWVYRVGAQVAKRLLFTGDLIDGKTAKDYGLALEAVPATDLNHTVRTLAERIAGVPKNQLMMHKVNDQRRNRQYGSDLDAAHGYAV